MDDKWLYYGFFLMKIVHKPINYINQISFIKFSIL